jgi:hypothetical protein
MVLQFRENKLTMICSSLAAALVLAVALGYIVLD